MKDSWICSSDDLHIAPNVLPVEHDIFSSPAHDVLIKSSHFQEVRSGNKILLFTKDLPLLTFTVDFEEFKNTNYYFN